MQDDSFSDTTSDGACCPPNHLGRDVPNGVVAGGASASLMAAARAELVEIPGGFYEMGARKTRYPGDLDSPVRRVKLAPFQLSRHVVSNALFAHFIAESGYVTTAEAEGWSYVFHLFLSDARAHPHSPPGTPWWRQVMGACWHAPEGPGSDVETRGDLPALHISWDDAMAFCAFTGLRLPTEAEWERAARGGLARKKFPWGNMLEPPDGARHNVWQGSFPDHNSGEDGHVGVAPVSAYEPNGYGLYNMTGNVWEWCADWFGALPDGPGPLVAPKGAKTGTARVVRGGSHLCHASYCERYQVHSRNQNTPDSSTGHMGFRLASDS